MSKSKKVAAKPAGAKASGGAAPAARDDRPDPKTDGKADPKRAATAKVALAKTTSGVKTATLPKAPKAGAPGKAAKTSGKPVPVEPPPEVEAGPKKWPKGGPTKADCKRYREALLEARRSLLASSKELASEALKSSGQDFSVDHMADHGSDNYEQDFSLKLLEGESEQLAEIRDALAKLDGKADLPFGLCEACSDDEQRLCETCPWIPPGRLEAVPHARLCVQTKEIEERRRG